MEFIEFVKEEPPFNKKIIFKMPGSDAIVVGFYCGRSPENRNPFFRNPLGYVVEFSKEILWKKTDPEQSEWFPNDQKNV